MSFALAEPRFWQGVWRVSDPKITLASVASMLLGTALAAGDGPLSWGWLLLTVAGIFCIEAAKNASGEIFDWDSGDDQAVAEADRTPFSGGKRVLVDGLLTRAQTWGVAAFFYALGGAAGLAIALWREPGVLLIGVAGAALAFFYHAPPLKLSYRGFGELAVALTYGPLICAGTYLVQRHSLPAHVWVTAVPLGLFIGAFLWVNELPDRRADALAGKRTLVVRLGYERSSWVFGWILVAAAVAMLAVPLAGVTPWVWIGAAGFVPAVLAARHVRAARGQTRRLLPAQGLTLVAFLLASIGMSAGLVLASLA